MKALLTAVAVCLAVAGSAHAQALGPAQRQSLTELAYALGQSHGLRQLCEGASDQYWRSWMGRLLEAESPDDAFDRRLRDSFNTGFASAQAKYPTCSPAARAEAGRAARRGKALARVVGGG